MSIEAVTSALIGTLGGGTAQVLYEAFRALLKDKLDGKEDELLPEEDTKRITISEAQNLSAALVNYEKRSGIKETAQSTTNAISLALSMANSLRQERQTQAKWSFVAALSLGIIGVIIIFVGVALLIFGEGVVSGSITTSAGIVSEIVAAILMTLHKDTNDRFDAVLRDINILESTQIGVETAAKIENQELRDQTLSQLATRINAFKTPE